MNPQQRRVVEASDTQAQNAGIHTTPANRAVVTELEAVRLIFKAALLADAPEPPRARR